jgi:hypothetical protein
MQELDSEQTLILVALLVVLAFVAGFMAGYAVRAAISQLKRWHYGGSYGRISARWKQQRASAFNTQSDGIFARSPVPSSSEPGILIETPHIPRERGTADAA